MGQTSTTDPNSLEIYDLGSDNAGFLAIIAQKLPEVSALALDDAGLVAGTATAAVHDEIAT